MTLLTLIAAVAHNQVIGHNNRLPWYLPEDLQHFKAMTLGKSIIMGRKTFDSIQRPLPQRRNIVVTRQRHWGYPGVEVAASLANALALVEGTTEAYLIGGADLYGQAMSSADRLCLTEIDADFVGDTFFPRVERDCWQEIKRECYRSQSGLSFAFVEYQRCR